MQTTRKIIDQTVTDFELSDLSMVALISRFNKGKRDEFQEQSRADLPKELLTQRFLMHPIRLAIMKLLFTEDIIPSAELRPILSISWGAFRTHIKSLEREGLLEVKDGFDDDGALVQTLLITNEGRKAYQKLYRLLQQFIEKHSPISQLLDDGSYIFGDEELYPQE